MNSVPSVQPTWMMLLIAIGVIAVLTIAISRHRLPELARFLPKILAVVAALLLAVCVGLYGLYWSRGVTTQNAQRRDASRAAEQRSTQRLEVTALESAASPVVAELESAKSDVELPEWTRQPVRVDGRRKLIVVRSGRFASEAEAELHGFQQAAITAVKEFASLDPRGSGAVQPQHSDIVKETAIKERFLEKIAEYDFGKFKAPMHQLWLQVELTPELGERLAEPWRQAAVEARLRTLTGWSLWSTVAAALAAFALRLDSAWNGRRRAVIVGITIALTLGTLAVLG